MAGLPKLDLGIHEKRLKMRNALATSSLALVMFVLCFFSLSLNASGQPPVPGAVVGTLANERLCEMVGQLAQAIAEKSRDNGVSREEELSRVNARDPLVSDEIRKTKASLVEFVYARKSLTANQLNGLAFNDCERKESEGLH